MIKKLLFTAIFFLAIANMEAQTAATPCDTFTVPTEVVDFNEGIPPCWIKKKGLLPASGNASLTIGGTWEEYPVSLGGNITSKHIKHNVYRATDRDWLISPSINLGNDNQLYFLEFDIQLTEFYSTEAPDLNNEDDKFAVVVSADNGTTWNSANAMVWSNEEGAENYYNGFATQQHLAIPLLNSDNDPYQGVVKIAFYQESTIANADNDLHIDNFVITKRCAPVYNLMVADIGHYTATVSWDQEFANEWEVLLSSGETESAFTTNNRIFEFDNLTPDTEYRACVRSVCEEESYSDWDTIAFTTSPNPCAPPTELAAISQTPSTLTVSWNNEAEGYHLRYQEMNSEEWIVRSNVSSPYTISDLQSNTIYNLQLQNICSDAVSDWGPATPYMAITQVAINIEENELENIQLFPNPAQSIITLENSNIEIQNIEVLDLSGRVVLQPNVQDLTINIQSLEQGIYFMRIITEKGFVSLKFVKQ